jgi:hypothetical protein
MPRTPTASRCAATLLGTTALLLATAWDEPGATDAVDAASPSFEGGCKASGGNAGSASARTTRRPVAQGRAVHR